MRVKKQFVVWRDYSEKTEASTRERIHFGLRSPLLPCPVPQHFRETERVKTWPWVANTINATNNKPDVYTVGRVGSFELAAIGNCAPYNKQRVCIDAQCLCSLSSREHNYKHILL